MHYHLFFLECMLSKRLKAQGTQVNRRSSSFTVSR